MTTSIEINYESLLTNYLWSIQDRNNIEQGRPTFAHRYCSNCGKSFAYNVFKYNLSLNDAIKYCLEKHITGCSSCGATWCD